MPNIHLRRLINPNPLVMAETLTLTAYFSICHTPLAGEMVKMQGKMNVSVDYEDRWCISSLETQDVSLFQFLTAVLLFLCSIISVAVSLLWSLWGHSRRTPLSPSLSRSGGTVCVCQSAVIVCCINHCCINHPLCLWSGRGSGSRWTRLIMRLETLLSILSSIMKPLRWVTW